MRTLSALLLTILICPVFAAPVKLEIYVNQVAFDSKAPKIAVIGSDSPLPVAARFYIENTHTHRTEFTGTLGPAQRINQWAPGKQFYMADFTALTKSGTYRLVFTSADSVISSDLFGIGPGELEKLTIPAMIHYFNKQRANTAAELAADSHVGLFGSTKKVDLRGGWCDASGDISKYFSHLAYANFMSPQQIPLVTWSLINTAESAGKLPLSGAARDSLRSEAIWGADYMMRSLSPEGYFYETVFSYFSKDPNARRVVGLRANSVTTDAYQAAFREGGGMAIAALARISQWKKSEASSASDRASAAAAGNSSAPGLSFPAPGHSFSATDYLKSAQRAFEHLLINNTRYDDDGKENIIDDYCALMAATELWIATDSPLYREQARLRAAHLAKRISPEGYFIADDGSRPFWHASDAGFPVIALCRYLDKEQELRFRKPALKTIALALRYTLRVTNDAVNPFGYARQTFSFRGKKEEGFFIPQENETGWWWQGENARLGSLATAALVGGNLLFTADHNRPAYDSLKAFAARQLSWILGSNPYSTCFMYGFGSKNVPYMHSSFGHGSERGGISNGITGKEGRENGSGIDYKEDDKGNEWRWTEQWLPHAAWFLQAMTALEELD